ncbi:MAG TPA: M1 family aminopeptidase, partial [Gammaproteobacteria bacterium]|nr:M1 family aminopeptidase [Gammaproteobacteria bacterium]
MNNTQTVTYLKDYQAPHYLIDEVQLKVVLNDEATRVYSKLFIRKNPALISAQKAHPLILSGEHMSLQHISLDGATLAEQAYIHDENSLTVLNPPEQFILEIETSIKPQDNTTLSGLYRSKALYCTQCESHGFRRITYFIDRPDVMSSFTVIIEADKNRYPILLSNGNCIAQGDLAHGHHWVKWHDPHKKPAYLFALVAGTLSCVKDDFTTKSGRHIDLRIYVEPGNESRVGHAMESLKQAMRWDEEKYGREYDLDIYMIVAVHDFNMGAMENKGLNIFNAKYIFANPESATDPDYQHIQQVIAHEYFHNWSGNRVTLRDWFQLSLKEGFTVFREQQFAHDVAKGGIQRIEEAKHLRTLQFVEDAGPM